MKHNKNEWIILRMLMMNMIVCLLGLSHHHHGLFLNYKTFGLQMAMISVFFRMMTVFFVCFGSFDSIRGIFCLFFDCFFQMENLYPVYNVRVCISSIIRVCLVYGSSIEKRHYLFRWWNAIQFFSVSLW